MFDPIRSVQGHLPTLLELLSSEYRKFLGIEIERRVSQGIGSISLEAAFAKAPIQNFLNFATRYLNEHRPIEMFPLDANTGVRLSNHVSFALCPLTQTQGTMQESGAVGVTHGKSQADLGNMPSSVDLPIF